MNSDHTSVVVLVVLAILPGLLVWLNARRLTRLARAKLEICRAVTGMEELMRDGKFTVGQACHDDLLRLMQKVQRLDSYPLKSPFHPVTEKTVRFRDRMVDELNRVGEPATKYVAQFCTAYFSAFRNSRPVVSLVFVSGLMIQLGFMKLFQHRHRFFSRIKSRFVARPLIAQFAFANCAIALSPVSARARDTAHGYGSEVELAGRP